jgi:hypothetical protein
VIAALTKIEDDRRRTSVADIAASWGEASQRAIFELLPAITDELPALDLVRLAVRIEGNGVVETLRAALSHPATAVRANALRALTRRAPPADADAAALACLGDRDETVRHLALEHVIRYRPSTAAGPIRRQIDALGEVTEVDDMKRLYMAHAAVGGRMALEWLLARLRQRSILGKSGATEERIAAAAALGFARCEDARADLIKLSRGRLVRRDLRETCVEALADLDRASPPRADRSRGRWSSAPSFSDRAADNPAARVSFRQSTAPPRGTPNSSREPIDRSTDRPNDRLTDRLIDGGEPRISFRDSSAPSIAVGSQPVDVVSVAPATEPAGFFDDSDPPLELDLSPPSRPPRELMAPPIADIPRPFEAAEDPEDLEDLEVEIEIEPPTSGPPTESGRARIALRASRPPPVDDPGRRISLPPLPPPPPSTSKSKTLENMISEYLNPGGKPRTPTPPPEDSVDDLLASYLSENE